MDAAVGEDAAVPLEALGREDGRKGAAFVFVVAIYDEGRVAVGECPGCRESEVGEKEEGGGEVGGGGGGLHGGWGRMLVLRWCWFGEVKEVRCRIW